MMRHSGAKQAGAAFASSRIAIACAAAVLALAPVRDVRAELVTVVYEARAVTVADEPFGLDVPLQTPVTGFFRFNTATPDDEPENQMLGNYPHVAGSGFLAEFLDTRIRGSATAFYQVQLAANPDNQAFRVFDGPRPVGPEGGVMTIDGVADEDLQLFLAIVGEAFDSDALENPFPFYEFGFLGTPHTFSLKDEQGTMLLQLDSAMEAVCGDPGGSGVSAGDALVVLRTAVGSRSCLPCLCDVDASGTVTVADALRTLKFAVGANVVLACPACG
jgi:hypothetical protein